MSSEAEENEYLLDNELYTDCIFLLGDDKQVVHCHKLFLAKSSTVFAAMLFGEWKEGPIHITDIEHQTFMDLVRFIYTRRWAPNELGYDRILALCYAAKKYMVHTAVKLAATFLLNQVTPTTVCQALEFANFMDVQELKNRCLKVIEERTKAVLSDPSFLKAERTTLEAILSLESLNIDSEIDIIDAVIRWGDANIPEGVNIQDYLGHSITSRIRFLTLSLNDFAKGPMVSNLLTDKEKLAMMEVISKQSISTTDQTQFSVAIQARTKPNIASGIKFDVLAGNKQSFSDIIENCTLISVSHDVILTGVEITSLRPRYRFGANNDNTEHVSTSVTVTVNDLYGNVIVTATENNDQNKNTFVQFKKELHLKSTDKYKINVLYSDRWEFYTASLPSSIDDAFLDHQNWYKNCNISRAIKTLVYKTYGICED